MSCCGPSCCAPNPGASQALGYSAAEQASVPEGANLGLGCGNPQAISDVVALRTIPDELRTEAAALSACVGGAVEVEPLRAMLVAAGFEQVQIQVRRESKAFIEGWMPGSEVGELVSSATIEAVKPGERKCCGPDCCT